MKVNLHKKLHRCDISLDMDRLNADEAAFAAKLFDCIHVHIYDVDKIKQDLAKKIENKIIKEIDEI